MTSAAAEVEFRKDRRCNQPKQQELRYADPL
jgi:hypothetical protein